MTDSTEDPEELLKQSSEQTRTNSTAATTTDAGLDRVDAITTALLAIEREGAPENINIRDARLKALLVGLEDAGDLEAVVQDLAGRLDRDAPENPTQSDLCRLLIRVGLQEALPDVYDDGVAGYEQAMQQLASDF